MGILFDILDTVLGTSDCNNDNETNGGFDQEAWDSFMGELSTLLDDDNYQRAIHLIRSYYQQYGIDKDYDYYWLHVCTYVRWLESDSQGVDGQLFKKTLKFINRASQLACNDDTATQVEEMRGRYEECLDRWYDSAFNAFFDRYDALIENGDWQQAEISLDSFYDNYRLNHDAFYYNKKCFCVYQQYLGISFDDSSETFIRQRLEQLLKDYYSLCDTDDDIHEYELAKAMINRAEILNCINLKTPLQKYDEAIDMVEGYLVDNPNFVFEYCELKRLVLQRRWSSTSVMDKNYERFEQDVVDAYKAWEESCSSDEDKRRYEDCYNKAFVEIMKEKMAEKAQKSPLSTESPDLPDSAETQYLKEVQFVLENGPIGVVERKYLERKRARLGLTEEQARRIEASATITLTNEEQEYASIFKDLVDDGEPTGRLRKMLDREAEALGLNSEQVSKIESMIK